MSNATAPSRAASRYSSPGRSESIRKYRNRASLSAAEVESDEWRSFLYAEDATDSETAPFASGPHARRLSVCQKKDTPYNLVIVGGGVAGASIAKELSAGKHFRVVLVDAAPFFENKVPILENLVDSSIEAAKSLAAQMAQHEDYLMSAIQRGSARVVIGTVKEITLDSVIVQDETIPYDFVVIATGREYHINPNHALSVRSLNELAMQLNRTKKVVIVGGGSVGCALANSIRKHHPSKRIAIVECSKRLLPRAPYEASAAVKHHLITSGIEVICSETASFSENGSVNLSPSGRKFGDRWMKLRCIPGHPRTQFLEKAFAQNLDMDRFIIVNEFFQIGGHPNMFAVGDVCSFKEEKTAERAMAHADLVIDNLKSLVKGRPLQKRYKPLARPPLQVIGLSESKALAIFDGEVREVAGTAAVKLQSTINSAILKRIKSTSHLRVKRGHQKANSLTRSASSTSSLKTDQPAPDTKILVFLFDNAISRAVVKRLVGQVDCSCIRVVFRQFSNTKELRKFCEGLGLEFFEYSEDAGHTLSRAAKGVKTIFIPLTGSITTLHLVRKLLGVLDTTSSVQRFVMASEGCLHSEMDRSDVSSWSLECEEAIKSQGFDCISVRTSLAFSSIAAWQARNVRLSRALRLPFPQQLRISWIHPSDIAKVVVSEMLGSSGTKTIELTGPAAISGGDIAQVLTSLLGETVYYIAVPLASEQQYWESEVGLQPEAASAFVSLASVIRCGSQAIVLDTFSKIVPADKMRTHEDWLKENIHDFL